MRHTTLFVAGIALAATAAGAQEAGQSQESAGGLTTEDARAFVAPLAEQAETAVESGDWQGIAGWLSEHVAEDAPIAMTGGVLLSGGPAVSFEASMKGADLARFAHMATGSQPTSFAEAIRGYSLETEVMGVWQIPGGKVSMAVAFYESGEIAPPEGSDTGQVTGVFSSATECAMRLGGTPDAIEIEMASCEAHSML